MKKKSPVTPDAAAPAFDEATALRELAAALVSVDSEEDMLRLMEDLWTSAERADMARRWALVRELLAGRTQRSIARDLGMSLCKITRGAKMINAKGSILRRLAEK